MSFMAKQTKKILRNIKKAEEIEKELVEPEKPKHKAWESYVLGAVICLSLFLLTAGWDVLNNVNRAMYITISLGLISMYAERKLESKWPKERLVWLSRGTAAFIIIAIGLFILAVYTDHFA